MPLATLLVLSASSASAQTGDGSLRGYVKDQQGGLLPGVTVTATSPDVLTPVVAIADSAGYYRLNNLPPATYTVKAEIAGFATYKREGILGRWGRSPCVLLSRLGDFLARVSNRGRAGIVVPRCVGPLHGHGRRGGRRL